MNDRLINATGPIPYGLTNDCMFHFVFQKDIKALKSLVCSVLHLEPADVNEIEVCNPIEIGHAFDSKKFHLDLKVKFNNNTIVNLEMQVMNRGNWPERSLSYLCRSYDNLNKGKDYKDVYSAVHIGFIDFTLFSDEPEFCATYMISNVKSHRIYSSKFALKVVELNNAIELTKNNTGCNLNLALNYGGRLDIKNALVDIIKDVKDGNLNIDEIDENTISNHLSTKCIPDPDLMIRTSGEERLSNFLLWEVAYSEFYFADVHWPDFDEKELQKAIFTYQNRDRRFGGIK